MLYGLLANIATNIGGSHCVHIMLHIMLHIMYTSCCRGGRRTTTINTSKQPINTSSLQGRPPYNDKDYAPNEDRAYIPRGYPKFYDEDWVGLDGEAQVRR